MLKSLLALALLIAVASCQNNIDTTVPIVRSVSDVRQFDYFSYSIVLHQLGASSPRATALANTRIIVSAPMYNINGAAVENTGAVWSCPVNPGSCDPITDSNRLFDMQGNNNENKTNQFLGSSMVSNGNYFMVCAHRHKVLIGGSYFPRGMCYYSDRDLSGFSSFSPCSRFGSTRGSGSGVCNAGASAVVTSTGSTNQVYAVGAPGAFLWRGSVARLDVSGNVFENTGSGGQDAFSLFGYTMVAGRFSSTSRLDYAVSNPRHSQQTYLGRVAIVMNSNTLTISNQPLNGQQMGEYYGFSLLAANLAGGNSAGEIFDELIVGAPMYRSGTQPDTGRIFVYANNNGALSLVRTIVGRDAFARFGHAMANLGDINNDGYDDIAVSAPFGSGSGSVYIFYSSPTSTISLNPAQIITGELVNSNLLSPMAIQGFGTSLASGVDVDGNTYNDLAVGTILSQQVYLLRTRPLAQVAIDFTSNSLVVDLDNRTCSLRGSSYACFDLTVCLTYSGSGLNNNLALSVVLFAERQNLQNNLEQRIFFDNGMTGQFPSMFTEELSATISIESCFTTTAYVQNGITDRFNEFSLDVMVTPPILDPGRTDGNAPPMDFSGFPIVSTTGTTMIQVDTFKDCSGGTCVPDLGVAVTDVTFTGMSGVVPELTVGAVNQVNIELMITNNGDDAFQSTITLRYRTTQLQLQRVYNNTVTGQLTLFCMRNTQDEFTIQTCNIGNPFNSNGAITINALFSPRPELVGNEGTVDVQFNVGSVSEEAEGTTQNNIRTQELTINARANVILDVPGIVFPVSVSYSNTPPQFNRSVTELGPSIRTTFVVRNSGPSSVPTIELTIRWPIDGPETNLNNFLYPASISAVSTATVVCSTEYINSENLDLPEEDETDGEVGQGVPSGKKRRRRSVPKLGRKVKRQAVNDVNTNNDESEDTTVTLDRTFSCVENVPTLNCVPIVCSILGLQGGSSAQVEILSYLDERYFHTRNDRFTFVPTASVRIVDADYIITTGLGNSSANITAIPAGNINPNAIVPPFPWYAVVFPIIAVIIIIVVIAVILYFGGFFRRAKHEEIKQKREELQNLAENGVTAEEGAPGEGTNL